MSELIGLGDYVSFEERLAETIAWCQPRVNLEDVGNSLRSSELKPEEINNIRSDEVLQVICKRGAQSSFSLHDQPKLGVGRLLAYFPDEQLCEGAAEASSKGFFDQWESPPWDTWVGIFRDRRGRCIVSWVPPELIDYTEEGILVNCVDCIGWLSNVNVEVARNLRERGLID